MTEGMAKTKREPGDDSAKERVRMIFDTTEEIRTAAQLRAVKDGENVYDVINAALRAYLPHELVEARRYIENRKEG